MKVSQIQMNRSSSIAAMKIDFNPRQAIVGSSSIDRLPIRKSNSTKALSQASQKSQSQQKNLLQSQQYSIDMLKRINESLERENAYLKKQLEFFTQTCSSKRSSISSVIGINGINTKKRDERLLNRIESRVEKNQTESTGLFNSKMSSGRKLDSIEDSISEIYSKFKVQRMLPTAEILKQVTSSYMESISDSYLKLKILADEIAKTQKTQKFYKEVNDMLAVLQTVAIHTKNPKLVKNLFTGNKTTSTSIVTKKQGNMKIEDMINDGLGSNQLINIFESLTRTGLKNNKFIGSLRTNLSFTRLVKRMAKNQ